MNKTKKGIVAFLLAAVLLISMVGMASAYSQTWDLDSNDIMYKTANAESGTKTISASSSNVWKADQAAQCDCTFQEVNWDVTLKRTNAYSGQMVTAKIGVLDGTTFTPKGTGTGNFPGTGAIVDISFNVPTFTVPKDKYLALKVCEGSHNQLIVKTYLGCSHVTCPHDEPDYPVPELSTIILTSTGLLALMGYVVYSRRNTKK